MSANEDIFDLLVRHQTYMLRHAAWIRNQMIAELKKVEPHILDIVRRLQGMGGLTRAADVRKLDRALLQIQGIRKRAWEKALVGYRQNMGALARAESTFMINAVESSLPVQYKLNKPKAPVLRAAVNAPVQGRTTAQWGRKLVDDDTTRLLAVVRSSVVSEQPIIRATQGTFSQAQKQIDTVTRTVANHITNAAHETVLKENDELGQEMFVAVLDDRTTLQCASLDSKVFAIGRGPQPPLHFGCRSIRILVLGNAMLQDMPLKPGTEKEMIDEYARKNKLGPISSRSELPFGHKGKFDDYAQGRMTGLIGGAPGKISYSDWLRKQPVDFQIDTLGPTRAALFRNGGLDLDKFVNRSGDSLTLSQIFERHSDAFRRSGVGDNWP